MHCAQDCQKYGITKNKNFTSDLLLYSIMLFFHSSTRISSCITHFSSFQLSSNTTVSTIQAFPFQISWLFFSSLIIYNINNLSSITFVKMQTKIPNIPFLIILKTSSIIRMRDNIDSIVCHIFLPYSEYINNDS